MPPGHLPAKRRATAGVDAEWLAHPICCCGCSARLEVAKNPERQSSFKPGHDSALKSLLQKINRGEAKSEDIPQAARANVTRIKFIQADPEFQKAFAKPSQPQRRQRKAASGDPMTSETSSLTSETSSLTRETGPR